MADTSSRSFAHDGTLVIDGWWITAADRKSSPYVTLASIEHNDYAGIHGPQQAISLDDYVGTGGVGSPDVNGNFTVSGAGSVYVDLPSNFETRLAAVTAQNFPEGMGGAPGIYWYHRADLYAAFDGEPGAQSGTWSEPAEACYCGWGWACLRLEFPTCPADALLTVTLTGKTFTHSDNHYTGSIRQEEYQYSSTEFAHTYSCQLVSGVGYVYLAVPNGDVDPDLEVVERITISGFGNGSWQIAEPRWCEDPTEGVEQQRVKIFQNWRYADGGISAVSGSSVRCCLQDGTEGNSGKDNPVETRTVRMFDVIESENYMVDLTAAKSLAIMCGDVTNVCDAWTCTYAEAAAIAATTDADSNVLKTVSAIDLREVTRHTATGLDAAVRVCQWSTVPGVEYDFTAEKIVGGSMQGVLIDEDLRTLVRSQTGAKVWVRAGTGGTYALHDEPTSNAAAVWRADSGDIYASFDPDVLNNYGVSYGAGEIGNTGRWAAREYDFAEIIAEVVYRYPFLLEGNYSRLYLTFARGGEAWWTRRMNGDASWEASAATGMTAEAPAIAYPRRQMHVDLLHGDENALAIRRGQSDANAWIEASDTLTHLRWPYPIAFRDKVYILGYSSGNQVLARYNRESRALLDSATVAASDASSGALVRSGVYSYLIAAVPSDGDTLLYQSWRDGQAGSWTLVATLADLLYPSLCDDGRRVFVGGYDSTTGQGAVEVYHSRDFAPYGSQGRVQIATAEATRVAIVKQRSQRGVVAALIGSAGVEYWRSWTDGKTWTKVEDIA